MKQILYTFAVAALMMTAACSDNDEEVFDVKPTGNVSFTPRPGGAVMKYVLPDNSEIKDIKVRYNDVNGQEVTVLGSYLCDSLTLVGFNEARQNIPVYVSYINRQGVCSEEYETTFSTGDSGPYAFFTEAEVKSAWDGFQLSYNLPDEGMTGFAHVFRVGTNPNTGLTDTLLISSITLKKGEASQFFKVDGETTDNTIVIKTEDFRGYFVKTKVWENVKSYPTQLVDSKDMVVTCPLSLENSTYEIGLKYLTDGDTKGRQALLNGSGKTKYYTFVMGPNALGQAVVCDLGTPKVISSARIYTQLKVLNYYSMPIWKYNYTDTLPCEAELWGSNDQTSWTLLGSYSEPADETGACWYNTNGLVRRSDKLTLEQLDSVDGVYLDITVPLSDDTYRYLKVVPTNHFDTSYGSFRNTSKYVTMQELEIYIKK